MNICWLLTSSILVPSLAIAASKETELCPPGMYYVRAHQRAAYSKTDGSRVRAANVKASCRTRTKSYEFWVSRIADTRPEGWPHKAEKSQVWTIEQKEKFFAAVDKLPELFSIPSLKQVYRMKQSWHPPNPATHADGMIVLYDIAFAKADGLTRFLAHELSHELFRNLPDNAKSYTNATGWKLELEGDQIVWSGRKSGYVDDDGKNSRSEDFASNVEFFLFEPEKLRKATPEAYKWIQDHYGDKLKLREASQ